MKTSTVAGEGRLQIVPDNYLNMADPNGNLLYQQLPILPNPSVMGQIVPALADARSRTAYSADYSSDTNSALDLFSLLQSLAALPSESSPLSS
jgi:hypothetical protein